MRWSRASPPRTARGKRDSAVRRSSTSAGRSAPTSWRWLSAGAAATTSSPTEPASSATAAVFDPELALKQCLNKPDMLQEMIGFFFKDVDNLLPQIRAALERGDLAEVGRLGHRLKGTIGHVGAEAARQAALRVERLMLHAGEQPDAEEAVKALERECEVLKQVLSAYQSAASPPEST